MSKSNALKNSFIPKRSPLVISRILSRLTTESLLNLCLLWCSMPLTYPRPTKQLLKELGQSLEEYIKEFKLLITDFKTKKTINKRRIIDRLLVDYYPHGLNLLQYAQIDSQLIVEKPQGFLWQTSQLIQTTSNTKQVLNLYDPQTFLEKLVFNLSKYYMNHIYISHHPHYPLMIIRIQLFDLLHTSTNTTPTGSIINSLISRKPFLIALPHNSPNLIHSPTTSPNDPSILIILQSISSAISISLNKQVRIKQSDAPLMKSLESLHIIHGNSRFAESLGVWTPYADGVVDISPFDDAEGHQTLQSYDVVEEDEDDEGQSRREKVARLRFKGTLKELKTEKLYEDDRPRKKRRVIQDDDEEDVDEVRNIDKNEYSSITPIQFVEFEINGDFKEITPCIKLKLQGNDVFAGLHELCCKNVVNPELIPGFLTGEEGLRSGVVENGVFIPKQESSNGGNGDLI